LKVETTKPIKKYLKDSIDHEKKSKAKQVKNLCGGDEDIQLPKSVTEYNQRLVD